MGPVKPYDVHTMIVAVATNELEEIYFSIRG